MASDHNGSMVFRATAWAWAVVMCLFWLGTTHPIHAQTTPPQQPSWPNSHAPYYPPQAAPTGPYLFDVVKKPAYARALTNLLSARGLRSWTRALVRTRRNYVGTPIQLVSLGGTAYELFTACKPHECADSRAAVLFAPNGAEAWAGVYEAGKPIIWLGAPKLGQQEAMEGALRP